MAAWTYHVTSKEVENHILKHDWLITHLCMHKQPTLTKQWKYFFANISYIVISDTLVASFLDVFVLTLGLIFSEFHVNLGSKDSVFEKRNRICVCDETFLTARPPFYVILCCCLRLLPSPCFPSDVLTQWLYGDVLCDDIMSKRSKIWKSLAIYYSIYYFRLCFSFSPNGHTTSNRCRFDVDIMSIRRRPNFGDFPRRFHVLFRCNFTDRKIHVVST